MMEIHGDVAGLKIMSAQVTLPDGEIVTILDEHITSLDKPTQELCRAVVGDGSFIMSSIPDPDERIAHYLVDQLGEKVTHVRSTGGPGTVY